ncbi:L-glutamate gamma-semialdehyde dehydrogenase [Gemmatimonadota bacterium]
MSGILRVPEPFNEPVFNYAPGEPEREELKGKLDEMAKEVVDIPLIIGGEEIRTGDTGNVVMPHDHEHVLATYHKAGPDEIRKAVTVSQEAHREWAAWPWEERAAVFLKAGEILATTWRSTINASTMLGQSKTSYQAEIDAAAELVDFFRFNAFFAQELYEEQPISSEGIWNWAEYRPLEGFIYAITPFNFTSIAGNLPTSPALMGNTVLWKPARTALHSAYFLQRLFEESGLPPGVINLIMGNSAAISDQLLTDPDFGGVHFTGSTPVFQSMWKAVGNNIGNYRGYPRLVGETGGKDFIVAHASADPQALLTAIVRGAFEYQGQKCSAASRVYVPEGLWGEIRDSLIEETEGISMGDPRDFQNFMCAVIDKAAFENITGYIKRAQDDPNAEVIAGGTWDDSKGYFIRPTIIQAKQPRIESMCEEIFGPVVTVYVYAEDKWAETLELVDQTGPYALTGAVFGRDRRALMEANRALRFAAGNFYLNDKPTGAVVGQQPFGGGRASGTNDKAGSKMNLLRWVSARSVKENFVPPTDYRYPYMDGE